MVLKKAIAGILLATFTTVSGAESIPQTDPITTNKVVSSASVKYANALHLAYIQTSSSDINNNSRNGLKALSSTLTLRTSVEPEGVAGLNIETDEISFFPFIYWPVTSSARPLSEAAQKKVQNYIDTGGVILFDVLDQQSPSGTSSALKRILKNINIAPLTPVKKGHTLTKSFYLVSTLQGTTNSGKTWVESLNTTNRENVSSVIIGKQNWAAAWAGKTLKAESYEREMALRSGVNMVMFSLSGNYKSDQIHVPTIVEKLGK